MGSARSILEIVSKVGIRGRSIMDKPRAQVEYWSSTLQPHQVKDRDNQQQHPMVFKLQPTLPHKS